MQTRLYIERQEAYQIESETLKEEIKQVLNISLSTLRYLIIYEVKGLTQEEINKTLYTVFAEKNKDKVYFDINLNQPYIAYEYHPGQYDQRSDSAKQCVELLVNAKDIEIKTGTLILFEPKVNKKDFNKMKSFLINKVEAKEKDMHTFHWPKAKKPTPLKIVEGFIQFNNEALKKFHEQEGFAMTLEDLVFIQDHFKQEHRNPTDTELKVLDTYWSDHCRHTTFETILDKIDLHEQPNTIYQDALKSYKELRRLLKREDKPKTLMDLATINARYEKAFGTLNNVEDSEEHNAASIIIDVDVDEKIEPWLLMFKNETHNHPTEIEPFGGASTCIGGAIRDPLSGRSYVYSATRISGASDITLPIEHTLPNKLPQRVISKKAAEGYASYGNQIGLATTFVEEIYHPGYEAKRMEVGAVIGAAPLHHVLRESPKVGDLILVIGGRTGRDGIGGATGSSKTHDVTSLDTATSEVQKGNAVIERKLQRLFRNKAFSQCIKKANDFGAGGVSVAIGELADGLHIKLEKLPVKYEGLSPTELAISESQERMAIVIDPSSLEEVMALCHEENLEASLVAHVTQEKRLLMTYNDQTVCDISREFIDTAGVRQKQDVILTKDPWEHLFNQDYQGETLSDKTKTLLKDLNIASQQGMVELFDSTIGTTTVIMPYGGKYQKTKAQASVQRLPIKHGNTHTVSIMTYGYDPYLSEKNPYIGATYAIIDSIAKTIASGGDYKAIRFTFQEYFERLGNNKKTWGKPLKSLLGALETLKSFGLAAIGGKDSMSGTFENLHVPPTLISFAVSPAHINDIISNVFIASNHYLYLAKHHPKPHHLPNVAMLKRMYEKIHKDIQAKKIVSAYALSTGGLIEALIKASFGNRIGVDVQTDFDLYQKDYGSILIESHTKLNDEDYHYLGKTTSNEIIKINELTLQIEEAILLNEERFKTIYPIVHQDHRMIETFMQQELSKTDLKELKPKEVHVLLPIFPGTNCEYDSEKAFTEAGAKVTSFVFNNLTKEDITQSIKLLAEKIDKTDILMLSGGFSSGDEPDGSGKFIANVLRHALVKEAIQRLRKRKGLILGICNGFQALIKSGLLPYGEILDMTEDSPSLYKNLINRHNSKLVYTKALPTKSPWLNHMKDKIYTVPISHTEGRFVVSEDMLKELINNHQIAFQYVDESQQASYHPTINPNGSTYAIEGIVSKDGLILGKMAHSERLDNMLYKNIPNMTLTPLFINAVNYIKQKEL